MILGTDSVLVLNYYQPWTYAGSERFNQLAWEELRLGRSQAFVYVADAGQPDLVEASATNPQYERFALYQLLSDGVARPMSPHAVKLTGVDAVGLIELADRLRPAYVRSHYPARDFVSALESPVLKRMPFVYDVIDLWDQFVSTPWGDNTVEAYYVDRADALVMVSRFLVERFGSKTKPSELVPNALDQMFLTEIRPTPSSVRRPAGAAKRVLYMGGMGGSWFDWEIVRALVQELPDHEFTLLGGYQPPTEELLDSEGNASLVRDAATHLAELAESPNVRVVPEVPHEELVPYLRAADVGIIPFEQSELTASVSPLKVFEYLAAGAPVVQIGMPDIEGYPGVRTARNRAEFVDLVADSDRATLTDDEVRDLVAFAARNTWVDRVAQLDRIVSNLGFCQSDR